MENLFDAIAQNQYKFAYYYRIVILQALSLSILCCLLFAHFWVLCSSAKLGKSISVSKLWNILFCNWIYVIFFFTSEASRKTRNKKLFEQFHEQYFQQAKSVFCCSISIQFRCSCLDSSFARYILYWKQQRRKNIPDNTNS